MLNYPHWLLLALVFFSIFAERKYILNSKKLKVIIMKAIDNLIGKKVIVSRDITTLQFLCERQLVNRETFDQFIPLAAENEWAEGTVFLLRLKEQHFPQKEKTDKYDFDEF